MILLYPQPNPIHFIIVIPISIYNLHPQFVCVSVRPCMEKRCEINIWRGGSWNGMCKGRNRKKKNNIIVSIFQSSHTFHPLITLFSGKYTNSSPIPGIYTQSLVYLCKSRRRVGGLGVMYGRYVYTWWEDFYWKHFYGKDFFFFSFNYSYLRLFFLLVCFILFHFFSCLCVFLFVFLCAASHRVKELNTHVHDEDC